MPDALSFLLDSPVALQRSCVGICINYTQAAIQNYPAVFFEQAAGVMHTQHGRDAQAAGENGGVALRTAMFGYDSGYATFVQYG